MELRDLEYFVVVAEERNFARAAERLHIVPSSVSERVRRLERQLGVELFERTSRRVALTADGRRLIGSARQVLSSAQELTALAGSLRVPQPSTLVISFAPNLGVHAGVLLSRLARDEPDLDVIVRSAWSAQALESLVRNEVAAALVRVPVADPVLESQLLVTYEDNFVALPEDDPRATAETIPVRSFEGMPVLVNERDAAPHVHDVTAQFFGDHGVTPRWRRHRLNSYESVLALVSAGLGSVLLHSYLAGVVVPGVVVRPLGAPGPRYELRLVWRRGDASAGVRAAASAAAALTRV